MIPFLNLHEQNRWVRQEIDQAIAAVLDSGQFVLGKFVEEFEAAFALYCNVDHAIAVNSGTSALHLALLACGVQPGDEVITTPFTFVATAAAIRYCGATPVYVDIDPATFNMAPVHVRQAITERTRVILPVHLFGQPAEINDLHSFGLPVIEDAAQAHGAEYYGKRTGSLGDVGCFSFYPTKNLGACGEGGMVTTNNPEIARKVRLLRDWGAERKYHHSLHGFNYRMEGLQAAILNVKLRHLENWTEQRRAAARIYDSVLPKKVYAAGYVRHVYHTYTIHTRERDSLQRRLTEAGVQTAIHYPIPVHRQPAYADPVSLPYAEQAAREVLSLPMYPGLRREHQLLIAEVLAQHDASLEDATTTMNR
ncbi:MAG TPA: DegT/DnrJ/EryC1/StrS family aminotransferase [Bryobacteraceae bacterium]|nr:DegT/DnrJ/EryC1/StrS family aminotransferase [Bryobacteraceae bacterium]